MAIAKWVWKETAEVLGVLGVIASMVFVGVEVRQNTYAVRGATVHAVSQQSLDLVLAGLESPELRDALAAAQEAQLTAEQERLMAWFMAAKLRADENRFRQVELGILDESNFLQLSNHAAYRVQYFAEYWARSGGDYAVDFQELVEREFLPLSQNAIPREEVPVRTE